MLVRPMRIIMVEAAVGDDVEELEEFAMDATRGGYDTKQKGDMPALDAYVRRHLGARGSLQDLGQVGIP